MPYPKTHRENTRKRIIESARRRFNAEGFERASITAIMRGAGLTHGGFYTYFRNKSELYRESMSCFFTDPDWKNCWDGIHLDLTATDVGAQIISAYLSPQHFRDIPNSCPMVALPSDVARSDRETKRAFETVFLAMANLLERSLRGAVRHRQVRAQAISALCVGGMVVARAFDESKRADALRNACSEVALELGGWQSANGALNRTTTRKRK